MAIYKNEYLPKNTIGVAKESQVDMYLVKSIKWFKYITSKENINIGHACNGNEIKINVDGNINKVDGFCEQTNTIYQFHGCYFHDCNHCYDELTINKVNNREMRQLYERTIRINNLLKTKCNLVTIWEHEFDKNKKMSKINLNDLNDLIESPKLRNSFYGGRTEPTKLMNNFKKRERERKIYLHMFSVSNGYVLR